MTYLLQCQIAALGSLRQEPSPKQRSRRWQVFYSGQRFREPGFRVRTGWSVNGLRRIRGNSELFSSAFADSPARSRSHAVPRDRRSH